MLNVSLKNLWGHKRRLFGTVIAVVLGVTFLVGTLVLGDTMRAGFNDLFTDGEQGTDAVVRSTTEDRHRPDGDARSHRHVARPRDRSGADGVGAVAPAVSGFGQIVGKNGNPIGGNGPPTLAASWTTDPGLNPWNVDRGPAAASAGRSRHRQEGRRGPAHRSRRHDHRAHAADPTQVKVVGILTIGGEDSLGAGHVRARSRSTEAQQLFMPSPDRCRRSTVGRGRRRESGAAGRRTSSRCCRRVSRPSPATSSRRRTTRTSTRLPRLLRGVPARVRGHRAARRDLQHLQHVLDHHRPAHARVRAAAGDRRVPPAGAAVDRARGARDRLRRRRSSVCSPASGSRRVCARCSTRSAPASPTAR